MNARFAPVALLALALFSAPAAFAEPHDPVAFDPARFAEQKAAIESDLRSDQYRELTRSQREDVLAALNRLEQTLAGKTSLDELSEDAKVQVFNDQELVNTLLTTAAEDSRVVCRREKKVGTNFKTNVCMTVAERRRAMDEAREALNDTSRASLPRVQ